MALLAERGHFSTCKAQKLFLAALVSLIEHIHTTGGIHQLHLARVERVRSVGDFQLHQRVLNAFHGNGFLGGGAGTGDEDGVV